MIDKYILDECGKPVPCNDLMQWARWFENKNQRIVKQEEIGPSRISTVFLSIDHGYGEGQPILWETMVFGGPLDQEQTRCGGNREQAEAMHLQMVERVKQTL